MNQTVREHYQYTSPAASGQHVESESQESPGLLRGERGTHAGCVRPDQVLLQLTAWEEQILTSGSKVNLSGWGGGGGTL